MLAQAYERHNTRQAEKILQFLTMLEAKHGFAPGRDRVFFTGSGAGHHCAAGRRQGGAGGRGGSGCGGQTSSRTSASSAKLAART